jgi:hypothetical protein
VSPVLSRTHTGRPCSGLLLCPTIRPPGEAQTRRRKPKASDIRAIFDDFNCGQGLIRLSLEGLNLLSAECCGRVIDYLAEKLQPYRMEAYRRAFEVMNDGFNSGEITFERVWYAEEVAVFQSLEARSIRNKGAKESCS